MWIIDFLAPPSCVFCGTPSAGGEESICVGCRSDLPWRVPAVSPLPGLFECRAAMMDYVFPIDVAIKAFKFRRKLEYGTAFAEILCAACDLLPADIDGVVPVPLHWRRKMLRGFNQSSEIAKPLARALGIPMVRAVRRRKATPFQTGQDARRRVKNVSGAFAVRPRFSHQHLLIVDDVTTTAATIEEIAKVLSAAGVPKISALSVAQAKRSNDL